MNTIREQITVLKAYLEGKPIEFREPIDGDRYSNWKPLDSVMSELDKDNPFDFQWVEYRLINKDYRPYASSEEFEKECTKGHTKAVIHKNLGFYRNIQWYNDNYVMLMSNLPNPVPEMVNYQELLDSFIWADDNSACGIKK